MSRNMHLSIFLAVLIQCSDLNSSHSNINLNSSFNSTEKASWVEESINIGQENTCKPCDGCFHVERIELDSRSSLVFPDNYYDTLLHDYLCDIQGVPGAIEYYSTHSWAQPGANVDDAGSTQPSQQTPQLSLPTDSIFAIPSPPSTLAGHQDQIGQMAHDVAPIQPTVQTNNTLVANSDKNAVGGSGLHDALEPSNKPDGITSIAVGDDNECRLIDLTDMLSHGPKLTLQKLATVGNKLINIGSDYLYTNDTLHKISSGLLVRCVQWRRMTLGYTYNPDDATKRSLSQMYVLSFKRNWGKEHMKFACMNSRIHTCESKLHLNILKLHAEMIFLANTFAQGTYIKPTTSNLPADRAASISHDVKTDRNTETEKDYRQALIELPRIAASLPDTHSWVVAYIGLICKHAVFFDSIFNRMLDSLNELDSMYAAMENALTKKRKAFKSKAPLANRKLHSIAKEVYGASTTMEWAKNECEQLLALQYDIDRYHRGTIHIHQSTPNYKAGSRLEDQSSLTCILD